MFPGESPTGKAKILKMCDVKVCRDVSYGNGEKCRLKPFLKLYFYAAAGTHFGHFFFFCRFFFKCHCVLLCVLALTCFALFTNVCFFLFVGKFHS